jgi:hypothetical protein
MIFSTQNHRITITDFRPCLICQSYSQASIYYYALKLLILQFKLTFVHLRYSLGGDRPSQTTHYTVYLKLVVKFFKSGISISVYIIRLRKDIFACFKNKQNNSHLFYT